MAGAWVEPKTWTSDPLTSSDMNEQIRDNLTFLKTNIALGAAEAVSVESGVIIRTQTYHKVLGEGDAVDNVDSIMGGVEGDIIIIRPAGYTITLKDCTGNLVLGADIVLSNDGAHAMLICNDAGNWVKFQWA